MGKKSSFATNRDGVIKYKNQYINSFQTDLQQKHLEVIMREICKNHQKKSNT